MNPPSRISRIIAVVLLAGVLPGLLSLVAHLLFGDARQVLEPLHACIEMVSSCIALAVAMLLLLRAQHEEMPPHLLWVAAALAAIGLIEGVHALTPSNVTIPWMRHGATLIGGMLFGLVWLPPPALAVRRKQLFVLIVAVLSLAVAVAIRWGAGALPASGVGWKLGFAVRAANALGGLGFLAAASFFLRHYLRQPRTEDLVFASQALLLSTAALLFGFSHDWAADWWVWHGLRLSAYSVVLVAAYEAVVTLYGQIARHAEELEVRVQTRTAELAAQREWLSVTLNSIGDAVISTDIEGRITFVNPAAASLTGWPAAEALGQPLGRVFQVVNEQTRQPAEDLVARVLTEKQVVALASHSALVTRDGREVPIEDSAAPIKDPSGSVSGVVLVFEDVAGKRRAQEQVRSAALFPEENPLPVLRAALDGTLLFANRAAAALLAQWECAVGQRTPELVQRAVTTVLGSGAGRELEIVLGDRCLSFMLVPVPDRNYVNFYARDVTERKRAEEEMRLAHRRLRRFVDSNIVGIVIVNPAGEVIEANDYYLRLIGFTREELEHRKVNWRAITPPQWLPADEQAIREMRERGSCTPYEKEYVRRDGTRVPVLLADALLPGPDEQIAAFALDVTDRKRAEREVRRLNVELEQRVLDRTARLEAANKELEAFSYSVSHDLRAPLRHIGGFAARLEKAAGPALADESRHYLEEIIDSTRHMGCLIDDLLLFSRMGRAEMRLQQVDLEQIVRDALKELQPDIKDRDIHWKLDPLVAVRGDGAMLRQVIMNLLSNAVKFTRARKPAEIEVGCDDSRPAETVVFLRDNGVGFDMAYSHKLFGVFQRLHLDEEFEGTGIGLASVRRIIARHGGRTWAESKLNAGATFYFSLPKTIQPPNANEPA